MTYESVQTTKRLLNPSPKTNWTTIGKRWRPSSHPSDSTANSGDTEENSHYRYENAYRIPCGLQLFSWGAAFDTTSASATARHMEQYGLEIETRTRMDCKNENEEMMKKLITYLLPIGIFVVLCGVGIYFGSLYFQGSAPAAASAAVSSAAAWGT